MRHSIIICTVKSKGDLVLNSDLNPNHRVIMAVGRHSASVWRRGKLDINRRRILILIGASSAVLTVLVVLMLPIIKSTIMVSAINDGLRECEKIPILSGMHGGEGRTACYYDRLRLAGSDKSVCRALTPPYSYMCAYVNGQYKVFEDCSDPLLVEQNNYSIHDCEYKVTVSKLDLAGCDKLGSNRDLCRDVINMRLRQRNQTP